MDIVEARVFARSKCEKDTTYRHLVSVEGVMRALSRRFGEDEETWALGGLFHDLDQDITDSDPDRHATLAAEWLRAEGVDEAVVNTVLAHNFPEYRTDLMARAIVPADAVAGLLVAAALVRPELSTGMKVSSVRKKLKDKAFAPGVNRDEIRMVEDAIGIDVDELVALGIEGLQQVAPEIEL